MSKGDDVHLDGIGSIRSILCSDRWPNSFHTYNHLVFHADYGDSFKHGTESNDERHWKWTSGWYEFLSGNADQ